LSTEQDRQIELLGGALVRVPVSGAVDDAEDLAGVGQRDDQRVITPSAVIGDINALLAARAGGDESAVGIDDGLVEEVRRLLFPDLDPGLIEDILKGLDIVGGEASAEVAGGSGVGNSVGAQGVKEDDIVASQFHVVEAGAVAQRIVGEVQDVVTFMIGEVIFEQVETFVDGFGKAQLAYQKWDGADATAGNGLSLGGGVIVDVRGGEDGLW
jgi:hypothetical protein